MKDVIKIERALLSSFLMNVVKVINLPYPENRSNVLNASQQIKEITDLIHEQDKKDSKKNKFKQLPLL